MRSLQWMIALILALSSVSLHAQQPNEQLRVTGKLNHVMGIGGETTGWAIALDSAITIDGKSLNSIQISYAETAKLQALEDKHVKAAGKLGHRTGVETGVQPVLAISSIEAVAVSTAAPNSHFDLTGTEWKLVDLAGGGVIENSAATLTFAEAGKIAGNDSCNRFFGNVEINADSIKLTPLGSTRMACPEPVMTQETKYTQALEAAERYEWKDPYLLIYCKGSEKPMRFTRLERAKP